VGVSRETQAPTDPELLGRLRAIAQVAAPLASALGITRYHTPQAFLTHAMLPALALLHALPEPVGGQWAEIGAGSAGLGLTLAAAAPSATFTLIDRRERVIALLDLVIARTGLPNVRTLLADLPLRKGAEDLYDGIVFRAFPPPDRALRLASSLARRWVAAWHTPAIAAYDAPPSNLLLTRRVPAGSEGLLLSLYHCGVGGKCR
jgi:16S rRNA G527 N7-methylase RsmG